MVNHSSASSHCHSQAIDPNILMEIPGDSDERPWDDIRELLESLVGEEMDAFLEESLKEKTCLLQDRVLDLVRSTRVDGTCILCSQFMGMPYMLDCSHAFCGTCLKIGFAKSMSAVLDEFSKKIGIPRSELAVPTDTPSRLALTQLLESYGADIRACFTFRCPLRMCKALIDHRPVPTYQHGALISRLSDALKKDSPRVRTLDAEGGTKMFDGFF